MVEAIRRRRQPLRLLDQLNYNISKLRYNESSTEAIRFIRYSFTLQIYLLENIQIQTRDLLKLYNQHIRLGHGCISWPNHGHHGLK